MSPANEPHVDSEIRKLIESEYDDFEITDNPRYLPAEDIGTGPENWHLWDPIYQTPVCIDGIPAIVHPMHPLAARIEEYMSNKGFETKEVASSQVEKKGTVAYNKPNTRIAPQVPNLWYVSMLLPSDKADDVIANLEDDYPKWLELHGPVWAQRIQCGRAVGTIVHAYWEPIRREILWLFRFWT